MSKTIDYTVEPQDNPVTITATITVEELNVIVTLTNVPGVTFAVKPTGNIIQKILSTVAEPIASNVINDLYDAAQSKFQGMKYNIATISGQTFSGITITPSNLALGAHTVGNVEMVKITGDINLTLSS